MPCVCRIVLVGGLVWCCGSAAGQVPRAQAVNDPASLAAAAWSIGSGGSDELPMDLGDGLSGFEAVEALPAELLGVATIDAGVDGPAFDMNWFTVDGGGATFLTGGGFELGSTAGQPDAGALSGGSFELLGGFWPGAITSSCYANCDGSTIVPVLNALDFSCFLSRFQTAQTLPLAQQVAAYANCDGSTVAPVLNALDFACYLARYQLGCP